MTDKQRMICELYPEHTGGEIARKLGISKDFVNATARRFGIKHNDAINKRLGIRSSDVVKEQRRRILELYPDHTTAEIAELFNLTQGTVRAYARKHGVKHNEAVLRAYHEKQLANLRKSHSPEVCAKRTKRRKQIYRTEVARVLSGLPQRTRLSVSVIPRKAQFAKHTLTSVRKYVKVEGDYYQLLYDEQTKRSGSTRGFTTEEYYAKKYGFKFMSYNEYYNIKTENEY